MKWGFGEKSKKQGLELCLRIYLKREMFEYAKN